MFKDTVSGRGVRQLICSYCLLGCDAMQFDSYVFFWGGGVRDWHYNLQCKNPIHVFRASKIYCSPLQYYAVSDINVPRTSKLARSPCYCNNTDDLKLKSVKVGLRPLDGMIRMPNFTQIR